MPKKDVHAVAMAKKRFKKLSPERRKEIGQTAAAARWAGRIAKRPASSRRKPSGPAKTTKN